MSACSEIDVITRTKLIHDPPCRFAVPAHALKFDDQGPSRFGVSACEPAFKPPVVCQCSKSGSRRGLMTLACRNGNFKSQLQLHRPRFPSDASGGSRFATSLASWTLDVSPRTVGRLCASQSSFAVRMRWPVSREAGPGAGPWLQGPASGWDVRDTVSPVRS